MDEIEDKDGNESHSVSISALISPIHHMETTNCKECLCESNYDPDCICTISNHHDNKQQYTTFEDTAEIKRGSVGEESDG